MTRKLPPIPRYKAAAVQFEPRLGDKEYNIAELVRLTTEAAENGARLIVHPEMATTGYCWYSREEVAPHVETIPGPTTERFHRIAKEYACYIVLGMPEVDAESGAYYNAAPIVGPMGLVGNYRKVQPFDSEPKWAKDGDLGFPVYETEIGNIGAFICMDAVLPETARMLALRGADVLAFPTNWLPEFDGPSPWWKGRALENGVYFIAADRWGVERGVDFSGGSCVISPDGTIQDWRKKGDCVIYGEVDIAKARDKNWFPESIENKMLDRRPDAYFNLTLNTYVANPLRVHRLYGHDPLPEGKQSRIAAVQFAPKPSDVEGNLARIEALLRGHPRPADLFVLPELAITGVAQFDRARAESLAQPVPGPATDRLAALAKELGSHIVCGLIEQDGDALYNAAVLVGPEGLAGGYRKLHLDATDRAWATAGDGFKAYNIPAGRVGMLIGYDALFPESARCLAVEGCDIIAVSAALRGPLPEDLGDWKGFWNLWRLRAGENNSYVAVANQYGEHDGLEFMGRSAAFGPAMLEIELAQESSAEAPPEGDAIVELAVDTADAIEGVPTNPVRRKELVQQRRTEYFALGHTPNPPVLELIEPS